MKLIERIVNSKIRYLMILCLVCMVVVGLSRSVWSLNEWSSVINIQPIEMNESEKKKSRIYAHIVDPVVCEKFFNEQIKNNDEFNKGELKKFKDDLICLTRGFSQEPDFFFPVPYEVTQTSVWEMMTNQDNPEMKTSIKIIEDRRDRYRVTLTLSDCEKFYQKIQGDDYFGTRYRSFKEQLKKHIETLEEGADHTKVVNIEANFSVRQTRAWKDIMAELGVQEIISDDDEGEKVPEKSDVVVVARGLGNGTTLIGGGDDSNLDLLKVEEVIEGYRVKEGTVNAALRAMEMTSTE
ncbi:MAG: hypothetical protein LBU29_04065, partial [Endomicrobium sp.]|nr:hypothetical protein [Endomicrobium sp.]